MMHVGLIPTFETAIAADHVAVDIGDFGSKNAGSVTLELSPHQGHQFR